MAQSNLGLDKLSGSDRRRRILW